MNWQRVHLTSANHCLTYGVQLYHPRYESQYGIGLSSHAENFGNREVGATEFYEVLKASLHSSLP